MPWPPRKGDLLPRCHESVGIEKRLRESSLKLDDGVPGPKAKGFRDMLRIDLDSIDHLMSDPDRDHPHAYLFGQTTPIGRFRLRGSAPDCRTRALQSSDGVVADRMGARQSDFTTTNDYGFSPR